MTPTRECDPYDAHGIPALGLRNYWYPATCSRTLGSKPQRVTMLGEDIVLFRESGGVFALEDRCCHRGARLSRGRCEFPGSGTITCPYHGWTYEGRTGQCVAALMGGPQARVTGRVRVKAYPAEDRSGIIWVFVGEMEPVPLDEDIPEWLLQSRDWFSIAGSDLFRCSWRALVDNWCNDQHAHYVHRYSPAFLLRPTPFARQTILAELPSQKGIGLRDVGGVTEAEFPGLGTWPRRQWYRVMKPAGTWYGPETDALSTRDGSKFLRQVRLPGYVLVGRAHRNYWLCRYATPIDEHRTRLFSIHMFRRRGLVAEAYDRIHYVLARGWADAVFSGQDKRVLEGWKIGPECLAATDDGVRQWRRFFAAHARRPAATGGATQHPHPRAIVPSGETAGTVR